MRAVSEWMWIGAGVIVGLMIFSAAMYWLYQANISMSEQRSLDQFYEVKNIIDNLCWSFPGNKREYKFLVGETIEGVYATFNRSQIYPKEKLEELIKKGSISDGNFLCVKVKGKRVNCVSTNCNFSFPFIGTVSSKFSLSSFVNRLIGKGEVSEYNLVLERKVDRVEVYTENLMSTTIPMTTTTSTTTSTTTIISFECNLNDIMNTVSRDSIYSYNSYLSRKPRPAEGWNEGDTSWNKETRDYLASLLRNLGLDNVRVEEFTYRDRSGNIFRGFNVIGEIGDGNREIIIGGHRDTVPRSYGAIDNGAGSSTVIEIARVFASKCKGYLTSKNYKLKIILFDSEELGLLGSIAYTYHNSISNVEYMMNFDCPSGYVKDTSMIVWVTNSKLSNAVDECCRELKIPCEKTFSNPCGYACSDYHPFYVHGINIMFPIGRSLEGLCGGSVYHTPNDNMSVVEKEKLSWATKLGACVVFKLIS